MVDNFMVCILIYLKYIAEFSNEMFVSKTFLVLTLSKLVQSTILHQNIKNPLTHYIPPMCGVPEVKRGELSGVENGCPQLLSNYASTEKCSQKFCSRNQFLKNCWTLKIACQGAFLEIFDSSPQPQSGGEHYL